MQLKTWPYYDACKKVLLFPVFTFIPKKPLQLPAFISFHSIHLHIFVKNFHGCKVIHEKREIFHHK